MLYFSVKLVYMETEKIFTKDCPKLNNISKKLCTKNKEESDTIHTTIINGQTDTRPVCVRTSYIT